MSSKPEPAADLDAAADAAERADVGPGVDQPTDVTTAAGDEAAGGPVPDASTTTLETLVRNQLSKALGGTRGMVEGAIPTVGFTLSWVVSRDLKLSLLISGGLALVLLLARLVQRSSVQFVLNSIVGIAIASVFALRSGRAEDAFLPGVIYNAAYAVVLGGSAAVRWPLVGFMIGGVTGDLTGWHRDRRLVALCRRLTLLLALPCIARVLVQYPLYRMHQTGWLGVSKLAMGWPLQIAALAAMAWVLSRDETQVAAPTPHT